jgi:hypothetical protein
MRVNNDQMSGRGPYLCGTHAPRTQLPLSTHTSIASHFEGPGLTTHLAKEASRDQSRGRRQQGFRVHGPPRQPYGNEHRCCVTSSPFSLLTLSIKLSRPEVDFHGKYR